ncbi:MAG: hypothetical protein ACRDQ4_10080 [Pseudonocardiaceae bacterium]
MRDPQCARNAQPHRQTGEVQSRELDETDVEQPNNVGDIEFTDSTDRALATRV